MITAVLLSLAKRFMMRLIADSDSCTLFKKGNNNMKRKFGTMPTKDELKFKKINEQKNEKISKAKYGMLLRERNDLKSQLIRESESNKNDFFLKQLEIDSLKYQNKCIQDKLNIANNTVALQIEENTKLNEKISHMDRIIKSLSDEITQKDGVIAYLENKLELNK